MHSGDFLSSRRAIEWKAMPVQLEQLTTLGNGLLLLLLLLGCG
jgi:hypothetical protein